MGVYNTRGVIMNIPIYRAKVIDGDEFVDGYLFPDDNINTTLWRMQSSTAVYEIDPSTLAIHFNGMVDKDSKKIFASLSKDGKGGDRVTLEFNDDIIEDTMIFSDLSVRLLNSQGFLWHSNVITEVQGIQK